MSFLEVRNLSYKYFYGALAVSDVSFTAKKGQVLTLLGKSESGKTSLLKCIAGIRKPACGEILLDGETIPKEGKKKNVGMIFENGMFFENRTVGYNLLYPLIIRKFEKADSEEKVRFVLDKFGLRGSEGNKVRNLTAAERIKLALARADLRETQILLCDDILKICNQDDRENLFCSLWEFLTEKAEKSIVIYATKEKNEALKNNGETVLMNYGTVMQQGSASDIAAKPLSIYAVDYFHKNVEMVNATIKLMENQIFIILDGEKILLEKKKLLSDIYIDKEVKVWKNEKGEISLFDSGSEKIIYFN